MQFMGMIARRSLSAGEAQDFPRLPEPFAPRRPLMTRRIIIDTNTNKQVRIPSHITTTFEEVTTHIEHPGNPLTIDVPTTPLGLSTKEDSLSYQADIPFGYPNPAAQTSHSISTPWGSISYDTPYEQYYNLAGTALTTFLEKAKKHDALDLVEQPYYLPSPAAQNITISELSNSAIRNPKALKHYLTITIRSLAGNVSQTYGNDDIDLQMNQPLAVVVQPDKNGGIYVVPTNLRDTGLNAYTYLNGVFSPFETVMFNAVGDTPAKYAADGTYILNNALNDLFRQYIGKINALQYEGMVANYFKDMASAKGLVMTFASELLGSISTTVTEVQPHVQESDVITSMPTLTQDVESSQNIPAQRQIGGSRTQNPSVVTEGWNETRFPGQTFQSDTTNRNSQSNGQIYSTGSSTTGRNNAWGSGGQNNSNTTRGHTVESESWNNIPEQNINTTGRNTTQGYEYTSHNRVEMAGYKQTATSTQEGAQRSVEEGNRIAIEGIDPTYQTPAFGGGITWNSLQTAIFGGYRNQVHSFMLGNLNDYLNRWVSIENDLHNSGRVANLFKNVRFVGGYQDYNKLAGKYEILITYLHPDDAVSFDVFLDHFGHAVDEPSNTLVRDVGRNFTYTMVGDDGVLSNTVMAGVNQQILNQFKAGVRVWNTLVRPSNYD